MRIVLTLLVFVGLAAAQPKPSVRPEFRDRVLQAVQDMDGVDLLSSETAFSINHLAARQSIMVVERMALGNSTPQLLEYRAAEELQSALYAMDTCRSSQARSPSVPPSEFKHCLDEIDGSLSKALEIVGLDRGKVYAHSSVLKPSVPKL